MNDLRDQVVFITGASSGIGRACAVAFASRGARLILAARRVDRLRDLARQLVRAGAADLREVRLDVRRADDVAREVENLPETWRHIEILVNNAGLSRGLAGLQDGSLDDWNEMIDTNIKGLLHVNKAVLPIMISRGRGTVIHIGSIAGRQAYPGGNVYCGTKHAVRGITDGLRIDLLGTGVRTVSIDPGMVRTEFSNVRFRGDGKRAEQVYDGMTPLTAEDVADVAVFAATRPDHVTLADILLLPTDQASAIHINRS